MHWARKKSGCFSNSLNTSEVAFLSQMFCVFLSHKALLCPPQRLQTTYQWWQRTLRPHSVDTKPRISLSSAPRKEGNRPHRWVVCWSCAMLFVHQGPAFTAHGSLLCLQRNCVASCYRVCFFGGDCLGGFFSQTTSSKKEKKKGKKGSLNRILKFAWQQHNPWSQCILTDTRRYLLEKHWWI